MASDATCVHVRTPLGIDQCFADDVAEASRYAVALFPMADVVTVEPIDCHAPWGEWEAGK